MSDELTPEERKALDSLPRERMPAGLEERVVGAMREHGFLEKRRRMIVLTNTRAAGLLAACVALVIGAYSIGLHRGGGGEIPAAIEMVKPADNGRADRPAAAIPGEEAAKSPVTGKSLGAEESAREKARQAAPLQDEARKDEQAMAEGTLETLESKEQTAAQPAPAAPMSSESDRVAQNEPAKKGLAATESEVAESMPAETPAPANAMNKSAAGTPAQRSRITPGFTQFPLKLMFNGTPVIIEAPEGMSVAQDDQGRTLLIYTSEGVIRIRVADTD
jgi:hypothetical protein